jgi:uncharacterized protein
MSLLEQIKNNQIAARKLGDKTAASLLTTLLGEASAIGKNAGNRETTDDEVVSVIKKFIKNINETVTALVSRNEDASTYIAEREILERYLPQQLNEAQLFKLAASQESMPAFMKFLKENYAGQYDGKLASTVAKSCF